MIFKGTVYESSAAQARKVVSSCRECDGACCRNMEMPLAPKEAERLIAAGTDLRKYPKEIRLSKPWGTDYYSMIGSCAFYDPEANGCKIYDDRPIACRKGVEPGDGDCQAIRVNHNANMGSPVPLPMPVVRHDIALLPS